MYGDDERRTVGGRACSGIPSRHHTLRMDEIGLNIVERSTESFSHGSQVSKKRPAFIRLETDDRERHLAISRRSVNGDHCHVDAATVKRGCQSQCSHLDTATGTGPGSGIWGDDRYSHRGS
jgi:hypothetical protein